MSKVPLSSRRGFSFSGDPADLRFDSLPLPSVADIATRCRRQLRGGSAAGVDQYVRNGGGAPRHERLVKFVERRVACQHDGPPAMPMRAACRGRPPRIPRRINRLKTKYSVKWAHLRIRVMHQRRAFPRDACGKSQCRIGTMIRLVLSAVNVRRLKMRKSRWPRATPATSRASHPL